MFDEVRDQPVRRGGLEVPQPLVGLVRSLPWVKKTVLRGIAANPKKFSYDWVWAIFDGLALSYGTAFEYVCWSKHNDSFLRSAREGIRKLLAAVLKTYDVSAKERKKKLKDLFAWFRSHSMSALDKVALWEGKSVSDFLCGCLSLRGYTSLCQRRILFQLSRAGRAGDRITDEECVELLDDERATLTRDTLAFERRSDRKSIRRFGRSWAKLFGKGPFRLKISSSDNSSFLSSVRKGGRNTDTRALVARFKEEILDEDLVSIIFHVCEGLDLTPFRRGLVTEILLVREEEHVKPRRVSDIELFPYLAVVDGPDTSAERRVHLTGWLASAVSLARKIDKGTRPRVRQVVVKERAQKGRVVAPSDSDFLCISGSLNSLLLSIMKNDKRLDPFNSSPEEDCVGWRLRGGSDIFRSSDLVSASQRMTHGISSALAKGVCEGLGLSPFLSDVLLMVTSPMDVWDKAGGSLLYTTSSGILMGLGGVWPLLALYNLWCYEAAWTESNLRKNASFSRRNQVRIVGDDLGASVPREVSDLYSVVLRRTGGDISVGKDVESVSALCLVEQLVSSEDLLRVAIQAIRGDCILSGVQPTWSVKDISPSSVVERDGTAVPVYCRGESITKVVVSNPSVRKWVTDRWSHITKMISQFKINPFLPVIAGGAGFPHPESCDIPWRTLSPHWVRALRVVLSQGSVFGKFKLMNRFYQSWKTSTDTPEARRHRQVLENLGLVFHLLRIRQHVLPLPGETFVDVWTGLSGVTNFLEAAYYLEFGGKNEPRAMTLSNISAALRRVAEELNQMVPYPRLVGPVKDLRLGWENAVKAVEAYSWMGESLLSGIAAIKVGHQEGRFQ